MKKIKKVLIANRGEIAVRILRSCKELGIETVSVYSQADENSLHVKLADESVCIGPAKSIQSYLNIHAILSAAEITGADAIHPGYGFLSENDEFSRMCEKCGITFIGPNVDCLRSMGDKIESKEIAKNADVPTLEPIYVNKLSDQDILAQAKEMTYPVLIKASAGGGGRGMKKIDKEADLLSSIEILKQEAKLGFGDDTLFIEKFVTNPRHIEVQILADKHGNVLHLGERDCTIQRRFQKVVEESPSPVIDEKTRDEMCQASVRLAKKVKYDSVGTVEYLYDLDSKKFYFMEMNTRIQVEHPITEQVIDYDLIREQIMVAAGVKISGKNYMPQLHSIECRINAEDPFNDFRPSPGKITNLHLPGGHGIRIDTHVYSGYTIPPNYDSMIAKLITTAQTRDEAIDKMKRALDEFVIEGIKTTIPFHRKLMDSKAYIEGNYTTKFMEDFSMDD